VCFFNFFLCFVAAGELLELPGGRWILAWSKA
jgi:hypothetical protein